MLKLTTDAGEFGPYTMIDVLEDRYRCDNADLPFSVVGTGDVTPWTGPLPTFTIKPRVPASVTMRQARLALLSAGTLDAVDTALSNIADEATKKAAQIEWEFASVVERKSNLVKTMAAAMGLSDADLDALFVAAGAL